jgi:Tol biopolymer transport system component
MKSKVFHRTCLIILVAMLLSLMEGYMNKKHFLTFVLIVTLALFVSALNLRAASQTPPPNLSRSSHEGAEELPFLDRGILQAASRDIAAVELIPWSRLVFQSYRDMNWEIYTANSDGSGQTRLTNQAASDIEPRLNRGCTRIAFASNRDGNWEIYTMNLDGSGLTRLTFNAASDGLPAWSPDGGRIVFRSYRDGQAEIYVMSADGSGQTRLTWDAAYDGLPAWSPDGTKIGFTSERNGERRLWVMNADGSGQTSLSSSRPYTQGPLWSPDGSQITFDADGDGDGRNELWLMNADGSNQHQVYDPPESETEAWVRSWSPDGRYIAFSRISWIYQQGQWYWTVGYLDAWDSASGSTVRLLSQNMEWEPDWQTTDALAPASSVNALPAQSPGPFTVSWSGSDSGAAGLLNYDVQAKDGAAGTWTDLLTRTTAISASYPGIGGHTYYFRLRARDNAYNVEAWPPDYDAFTTVEALPPVAAVKQLPAYLRNGSVVSWDGSDPGGSGIKTFDVQYRDGAAGSWTDWQIGIVDTEANFSGTAGHSYYFRARAIDNAQNIESWPSGDGDTSTNEWC